MRERAHPDSPAFRTGWRIRLRRGFIPWLICETAPYREAFLWRHRFAARHCCGKDVLDIPCGVGWGTQMLKGCRSLTGVDIAKEAIQEANQRYGRSAKFSVGDMAALQFSDGSFDLITCLEGIEHIPESVGRQFLGECHRVLRQEGQLILSSPHCPDGRHSGNPYHLKEYTPREIRASLQPYFRILEESQRVVDLLSVLLIRAERI